MVTWPANNTAVAAFGIRVKNPALAVWGSREFSDLERRHITLETASDGLVELLIMGVLLLSLCTSVYDDLTHEEFRNGRRAGKGLDYWFERRSVLWRLFRRKD